jgi:hypothetical protein
VLPCQTVKKDRERGSVSFPQHTEAFAPAPLGVTGNSISLHSSTIRINLFLEGDGLSGDAEAVS